MPLSRFGADRADPDLVMRDGRIIQGVVRAYIERETVVFVRDEGSRCVVMLEISIKLLRDTLDKIDR